MAPRRSPGTCSAANAGDHSRAHRRPSRPRRRTPAINPRRTSRSGASSRSSSPTWWASPACRRPVTPRTCASCSPATSTWHARSSTDTAAWSRSSSVTPSWPRLGTPTAHEDDAERAVRAGSSSSIAVRQLGSEVDASDLQLRAGVTTGAAAVTIGATGQGMVAGDMVNTASRLQSAAPPGTLLVDESTMRAASVAITFEPAGDKSLKGKELAVTAWRRSASSPCAAARPERGARTALRGTRCRDAHPQGAPSRHRPRTARAARLIRGRGRHRQEPPGMGVPQVHRRRRRGHLLAPGPIPRLWQGITFWALGEMVRKRAGSPSPTMSATTRERIAATVGRLRSRRGGAALDRAAPSCAARA